MRKFIVLYVLIVSLNAKSLAQIYGYEHAVELPTIDIYDTRIMNNYLNAVRLATANDNKLTNAMVPIIKSLWEKYNNGQYQYCIDNISDIFNQITFYTRQYYIYSPLLYIKGISYMKLGYEDAGISSLVDAKNAQDEYAINLLRNYFTEYLNKAIEMEQKGFHSTCLMYVNKARNTTFFNYQLYEVEGNAQEGLLNFDAARSCYNLAKKQGSPNARNLLKQLKKHQK